MRRRSPKNPPVGPGAGSRQGGDRLVPSLLFKCSFGTYVLEHFRVNGVAVMPVLYRMITNG